MTGYEKCVNLKVLNLMCQEDVSCIFNRTGNFVPVQMNALSIKAPIR